MFLYDYVIDVVCLKCFCDYIHIHIRIYIYICRYKFSIHNNDTLLVFQSFFSISTNYSRIMWINAGDVHVFQSTVSQEQLHKFVQSF